MKIHIRCDILHCIQLHQAKWCWLCQGRCPPPDHHWPQETLEWSEAAETQAWQSGQSPVWRLWVGRTKYFAWEASWNYFTSWKMNQNPITAHFWTNFLSNTIHRIHLTLNNNNSENIYVWMWPYAEQIISRLTTEYVHMCHNIVTCALLSEEFLELRWNSVSVQSNKGLFI